MVVFIVLGFYCDLSTTLDNLPQGLTLTHAMLFTDGYLCYFDYFQYK